MTKDRLQQTVTFKPTKPHWAWWVSQIQKDLKSPSFQTSRLQDLLHVFCEMSTLFEDNNWQSWCLWQYPKLPDDSPGITVDSLKLQFTCSSIDSLLMLRMHLNLKSHLATARKGHVITWWFNCISSENNSVTADLLLTELSASSRASTTWSSLIDNQTDLILIPSH